MGGRLASRSRVASGLLTPPIGGCFSCPFYPAGPRGSVGFPGLRPTGVILEQLLIDVPILAVDAKNLSVCNEFSRDKDLNQPLCRHGTTHVDVISFLPSSPGLLLRRSLASSQAEL